MESSSRGFEDEVDFVDDDQRNAKSILSVPGAPIEIMNPLGHEVTLLSAVMLNVGQLLGSAIYSVPGVILNSVGSTGLLLVYWIIGAAFALAGVQLYVELASMFPKRSGGEVVYLEQAYPRPRFFVPIVFAITTVLLSLSAINAIVFAQYFLLLCGIPITSSSQTTTAIGAITAACLAVIFSTKWSLRAVNLLTILKVICGAFVAVVGFAVLAGLTRVKDPYANFHDIFQGSSSSVNSLAMGLVKVNFAYSGWHNAFNLLGEVRGPNPVQVIQRAGYISVSLVTVLFVFINIAYLAVVPKDEMSNSGQLIAALFFQRVFGESSTAKLLPSLVALSCFSNIVAVSIGHARVLREVSRQGLLPYPEFFASTKPFGTPLGPVMLKYSLTVFVIAVVPSQDAYNFIVDLDSYPGLVFKCAMVIGVWILRQRRAREGLQPSLYQAKNIVIWSFLLCSIFLLVMPWVPPESGHGDVSFWYATYCVVGLAIMAVCTLYYYIWIVWLPERGGYTIVEEVEELPDGARATRLIRRYDKRSGEEDPLLAI